MSGLHLFGKNDFGTACIRCGYFNHVKEAGEECSGQYDEQMLADTEAQIAKLRERAEMVRKASAAPFSKQASGESTKKVEAT